MLIPLILRIITFMTDSKTSHWKSLAADLSGIPPEDREPEQLSTDSDDSGSSPATSEEASPPRGGRAPVVDRIKQDSIEVSKKESSPVSEDLPTKKKKRGSWAFWRSGNKEKKNAAKSSDPDTSVSEDPLALLNQAETTDDMAVAIDQLFANTSSDTRGEEVVFDADEVATSIDFDEDSRSARRESDESRSDRGGRRRDDGNSRRRRDGDDRSRPEGRRRDNAPRSRNDRDDSRRRPSNREDSRSRDSDRRDRNSDSEKSERRQGRRRNQTPDRAPIDHGDVPTWDTAVSFVVDNNMVTRDGKSGGNSKSRARPRKKTRN
jgi:hypothetical protein